MTSLASVIIVSELNGNKGKGTSGAYQPIARVNNEGSGIFVEENYLKEKGGKEAFYTMDGDIITFTEAN